MRAKKSGLGTRLHTPPKSNLLLVGESKNITALLGGSVLDIHRYTSLDGLSEVQLRVYNLVEYILV